MLNKNTGCGDLAPQKFTITKDRQDGTRETVWTKKCSYSDAREEFGRIINEQSYEYHQAKTLPVWRVIRLFDENGNQLAQES